MHYLNTVISAIGVHIIDAKVCKTKLDFDRHHFYEVTENFSKHF